jgi:hypothetical protein
MFIEGIEEEEEVEGIKGKGEEKEGGEMWFSSDVCEEVPPDVELIELRESWN